MSTGRLVAIARVITLGVSRVSRTPAAVGPGRREPGRVDHPQAELVVVEQRHRRAQGADRGPADLGDHLDHLLDVERLGQHRGRLLQPRGAQRGRRQLVGQPAAHLLGLALAGHVGAGADPLGDLPVPLDRHRPHVVVPVGRRPWSASGTGRRRSGRCAATLAPVALDPLAVLGVDRVKPPVAEELLHGLPGDPAPLGRVLEHLPVRRRHPDDLRAALDEGPVPLLAAAQRLFGGGPGGAGDHDEPGAVQARRRGRARRTSGRSADRAALPPAAPVSNVSVAGRSLGEHLMQRRLGPGRLYRGPDGRRAAGRRSRPAGGRTLRARAGLTQTNRKSVSRNAIPADASRSTASGSQDSNSPNPASRCFGTEVSALNRAPHLPCRRLPLAAPSCYRTADSATYLAPGGSRAAGPARSRAP